MLYFIKSLISIDLLLLIALYAFRAALAPNQRHIVSTKVIGLTLLTPAIALFAGNAYVYFAYLTAIIAFNSRSRAELGSIYLLMLPMMPMLLLPTAAGGVYLIPLSSVAAMNIGALIGFAITRPSRKFTRPGFDVAALLLVMMFVYIYGRGESITSLGRITLIYVITFAAPYLIVSRAVGKRDDIDLCLLRLCLAGFMAALIACFETFRHWVLYQTFYEALHVQFPMLSATLNLRGGRLRAGGPLVDYTVAGAFFAVALVLLPYLKSRFRSLPFWGVAGVIVLGLFATQSRGAWIAAAAGLVAILLYRGKLGRAALLAGFGGSLMAAIFVTIGKESHLAETLGAGGAGAGTTEYRKRLLSRGLEQIAEHPLFGQTQKALVGNLSDLVQGQHIVDFVNAHLFIAMTAGLLWFIVWIGIWAAAPIAAWRLRKGHPGDHKAAEVPFAMIVTTMTVLVATSTIDRMLIWPTIALALAEPCFVFLSAAARDGRARRERFAFSRRRSTGNGASLPRQPAHIP